MADDYRVKPRSDAEVRRLAKKLREFFGISKDTRVDVISCLKHETIWTVQGIKRLNYAALPDSEMGLADGKTNCTDRTRDIATKKSVFEAAYVGEGRARNTIAHELGHAVMHSGREMPRLASGNITPKWLKPFESAEHQAKVFASAFLINDAIARNLTSIGEISVECGVSIESAEIYFKELAALREREMGSERIRRLAEEFRETTAPQVRKLNFLDAQCLSCGNRTLFPVDAKFMCQHCDRVFDSFQDGDHA